MRTNKPKIKQLIWPDIETAEGAKTARVPALVFSSFGMLLWTVITIATVLGNKSTDGYYVFLYVTIFAIITYGLYRMSREAAIAYLVVTIVAVFFAWGHTTKMLSAVAGVFVAILAVRGTFSYARLHSKTEQLHTSNQRSDHDRA
jgi:uncharacterized membrane protein